jgi:hypothetical protein
LAITAVNKHKMAVANCRSEHAVTSRIAALEIAHLVASFERPHDAVHTAPHLLMQVPSDACSALVASIAESSTRGTRRVRELVAKYAWQSNAVNSGKSHWKSYLEFYDHDGRRFIPVTELDLLAYIGWLSNEKHAGRRFIAPGFPAHHLSAIRVNHRPIIGQSLRYRPMVSVASRACGHW